MLHRHLVPHQHFLLTTGYPLSIRVHRFQGGHRILAHGHHSSLLMLLLLLLHGVHVIHLTNMHARVRLLHHLSLSL